MKFRGLLVAVVLLAALGGVLYWSQHHQPKPAEATPALPAILHIDAKAVTGLTLRDRGAPPIVLSPTSPAVWQITSPASYRANADDVNQMVAALGNLIPERVVAEKGANLATYGLSDPSLTVDVAEKNNQSAQLMLGDKTPTGESVYALVPGSPRVYTVALWVDNTLGKSLDDLRDRHLIPVQTPSVNLVEIERKGGNFTIARVPEGWQIQKPSVYRTNNYEVDNLVDQIVGATWDPTANNSQAAGAFARGTPVATVKVTTGSGATAHTDSLEIRKSGETDYAQSSAVPGFWKIDSSVAIAVDRDVDTYRNKQLLDFGYTEPLNIQYHSGSTSLSLVRSNSDWYSNGKKMDTDSVGALVTALRGLAATGFTDSGYNKPDIDLTVVDFGGRSVEKVHFQTTPNGAIAKRDDGAGLYVLDSTAMNNLTTAVSGVKPAPPSAAKKK